MSDRPLCKSLKIYRNKLPNYGLRLAECEIERLMKYESAGDPMTGLKWTSKTTTKISQQLASVGIDVSARTVAGLLEKLGFCLRVNRKDIESGFKPRPGYRKARQEQFEYIANMREKFTKAG